MNLNRRTFVRGLGLGAVATLAAPSLLAAKPRKVAPASKLPEYDAKHPAEFWRAVRAQFPLLSDPVYLNTGGLGPASQPVLDMVSSTTNQLQAHSETGHPLIEPSREQMARFLGVKAEEVCFTRNATEGNSIIAAGLTLKEGDEVIFETHAHPGGSFPWINQAQLRGVEFKLFEPDPSSPEANLALIRNLITPRTKVIQVSHITCTTGLVFPVKEIAALAREHDIWFHIDGAQSVGMIPVDIDAIDCNSYAFSGHKWLGGPHETGVLYIRRSKLEGVAPTGIGAYSGELPVLTSNSELAYLGAASRHEYGTRNAALICGVTEATRFQERIGRDRIAAHGRELATQLMTEIGKIDGIEVLTPKHDALRASIVSFRHARATAGDFFGYLSSKHHLRCRPVSEQGLEAIRVSPHVFTSHEDCERIIAAVHASAKDL